MKNFLQVPSKFILPYEIWLRILFISKNKEVLCNFNPKLIKVYIFFEQWRKN
jgi:hypothetical protein